MQKKLFFVFLIFLSSISSNAQDQVTQVQETARKYVMQGDYSNAVLVLNRGLQKSPDNLDLNRDLAYTYYLQRDYSHALQYISPLIDRDDADVTTFQIAGNIYKALEQVKECDKMYKKALKKFPASGALYSEYGELLWAKKEPAEAIATWENGISTDPSWPGNYYHAAKYYFSIADKVWSLIYGEIFINMESYSGRTPEMKKLLLESYKKFYTQSDVFKVYNSKKKTPFEESVLTGLSKYADEASQGINTGSLTSIRTKFVTDWYQANAKRYPHRLFEHWQFMVREGMFDAYNQWVFGAASNTPEYELWVKTNNEAIEQFIYYHKNRVFKMPKGQYYGEQH